jgi:predicted AAA+ superfamily ATPase
MKMIIKRNIASELLRWGNAENRKPVILRGARQVGKTFVAYIPARAGLIQ